MDTKPIDQAEQKTSDPSPTQGFGASARPGLSDALLLQLRETLIAAVPGITEQQILVAQQKMQPSFQEAQNKLKDAEAKGIRDELTGLQNRAGLNQTLENLIGASSRSEGGDVSILYLDLDGFKQVNDKFGHPMGDQALRIIAERLQAAFPRETDTVTRPGGDEIVIVAAGKFDEDRMIATARSAIEGRLTNLPIEHQKPILFWDYDNQVSQVYPIGASIGAATYTGDEIIQLTKVDNLKIPEVVETLLKAGDMNMYVDKWGPDGKIGQGLESENPNAPKFQRLARARQQAVESLNRSIAPETSPV